MLDEDAHARAGLDDERALVLVRVAVAHVADHAARAPRSPRGGRRRRRCARGPSAGRARCRAASARSPSAEVWMPRIWKGRARSLAAVKGAEAEADLVDRARRRWRGSRGRGTPSPSSSGDPALPALRDGRRPAGDDLGAGAAEDLRRPERVALLGLVVVVDEAVDGAGAEDEAVVIADAHHVALDPLERVLLRGRRSARMRRASRPSGLPRGDADGVRDGVERAAAEEGEGGQRLVRVHLRGSR